MEQHPVTILMPVKNGGKLLHSAIQNIEAMLGPSDEVVVIDDNSTDVTPILLGRWADSNPQVRNVTNRGSGLVDALNMGLNEARFNWIARVDVDDKYNPKRMSVQKKLIQNDVVAIFSDYELLYEGIRSLGTVNSAVFAPAVSVSLISSQRTAHPSVLFNKSAVMSVGGYQKQDFPAEDLALWLRISRLGRLVSSPEVLLHYRVGKYSISGSRRKQMQTMKALHLKQIGVNPADIKAFNEIYFELFDMYGDLQEANARRILLFRDFRQLQLRSEEILNYKIIEKHFKQWLIRNPGASLQLSLMARERIMRNIYRGINFPKS